MARRDVIQIRVSEDEKERIGVLARSAGVSPSEWLRSRALEESLGTRKQAVGPVAPGKPSAVHPLAAPRASTARSCEGCGKPYGSPSLRRCLECNGRIVPVPA